MMLNRAEEHEAARCRDGYACTGTGCRLRTGKTQRKKNWLRPKQNKHEASRPSNAPTKEKK